MGGGGHRERVAIRRPVFPPNYRRAKAERKSNRVRGECGSKTKALNTPWAQRGRIDRISPRIPYNVL